MSRLVTTVFAVGLSATTFSCGAGVTSSPSHASEALPETNRGTVVVVSESIHDQVHELLEGRDDLRLVVAREQISAAERASEHLERSRALALEWRENDALAEVERALEVLEAEADGPDDYDALHLALAYRALIEANLERPRRAEASLRDAVRLRPEARLDEVLFPPDLREMHERLVAAVRSEQLVSASVTTAPEDASVFIDGVRQGTAPLTVEVSTGRHYVRVEALARSPRVVAVDLSTGDDRNIQVDLPEASSEETARQVSELESSEILSLSEEARDRARQVLDTSILVRVEETETGTFELTAVDLRRGDSTVATAEGEEELAEILSDRDFSERAGRRSAARSPWLWISVGLVTVGTAVGLAVGLTYEPDYVLRISEQH